MSKKDILNESNLIQIKQLRSELKKCVLIQLHKLPDTLEELEPKDRLDILIKILPFVMPKNENVSAFFDEPTEWESF